MLYIPASKRPDWSRLPLPGGRTGGHIETRRRQRGSVWPPSVQRGESTSSVLVGQEEKLSQIKGMYGFRDESGATRFLRSHPALIDLLLEAPAHVERCFGPNPQIVLEVVVDPEADDSEELFANIRTSLPVEEALEQLDRLDEGWFLTQFERTVGRFNFNVEFA